MLRGWQVLCELSHPPLLGHRTRLGPWLPTNPPVSLSSGVLAPPVCQAGTWLVFPHLPSLSRAESRVLRVTGLSALTFLLTS